MDQAEHGAQGSAAWLMELYRRMLEHFGPRGWWPARTPFEVAVGAILVQGVSWSNAAAAIESLRERGCLEPGELYRVDEEELAERIRPSLYYRQKARKLKAFTRLLIERFQGDMGRMLSGETAAVRRLLLGIHGIGPETADCILLYAGDHPVFVVDAYTRRIFARLGVWDESITYDAMQAFFHRRLPPDVSLYNEYHALIDGIGSRYCKRSRPRCGECPLLPHCPYGQEGGVRP